MARDPALALTDPTRDQVAALHARLDEIVRSVEADTGWIAVRRGHDLEVVCASGPPSNEPGGVPPPWNEGDVRLLVDERRVVLGGDEESSLLALPLESVDGVFGALGVVRRPAHGFSSDDVYRVTVLGSRLVAELARDAAVGEPSQAARGRSLLEAAETINASLDSPSLETTILAEATRLVTAQRSVLLMSKGDVLVAGEARGLTEDQRTRFVVPLEGSLFGRALLHGDTVAVEDVVAAGLGGAVAPYVGQCGAVMVAPLQSHRAAYGALALIYDAPQRFTEGDRAVLRTFAIQAAIALDNRRLMQEKDRMAVRDGLTGVHNRSYLEVALDRAARELHRNGGTVSVLFLDVDDMKLVNDTHGHQAGDGLLVVLAKLLQGCCRETDVVARYGGDEFVVLMPATDATGVREVARKVDEAVARHNNAATGPVRLSISTGTHTAGAADIDDLLREADRRMYAAKRARSR